MDQIFHYEQNCFVETYLAKLCTVDLVLQEVLTDSELRWDEGTSLFNKVINL